jgi:hypothetical protein
MPNVSTVVILGAFAIIALVLLAMFLDRAK